VAQYFEQISRTFNEYLLVPGFSGAEHRPFNISLKTPLAKFKLPGKVSPGSQNFLMQFNKAVEQNLHLNIPLTSAVMQAVSGPELAKGLAREGGVSFIFGSQSIESQAAMVQSVKKFKAGFVSSDTNIAPDKTLGDLIDLQTTTGHTTTAVTKEGTAHGKLLGIMASRDWRPEYTPLDTPIRDLMTPRRKLIVAPNGISLKEANDILWQNKLNTLPIVDDKDHLVAFVFRKDYNARQKFPLELTDPDKRLVVGAGINTRDYETRIPALVEAGVDILVIDSSEGFSHRQAEVLKFVRQKYGKKVKIGAGNVVDAEGFNFLAKADADFVKIGIGGGSICITREQKGIGRGNATALQDVARAREAWLKKTGEYIPLCIDGGIVFDYHITLALAMGADFAMLGRYFARFDESPSARVTVDGAEMKEYWGEGSARARNWQRYDHGGSEKKLSFEEGVDSYVPFAGNLHDGVGLTLSKIRATMCNVGALNIAELQQNAKLTLVSATSIIEGGAHDVIKRKH